MFYFGLTLATVLIIIPAWFSFDKDRSKESMVIFGAALIGAALSFCTGYIAHKESLRNADTAHRNDSLYKNLLSQNLKSARKIIDSLDTAVYNSRTLIKGSNLSLKKLNEQFKLSTNIQQAITKSNINLLRTLSKTEKKINENLTGGQGMITIELSEESNAFVLMASNLNSISIPNVQFQIYNYTAIYSCLHRNGKDSVAQNRCALENMSSFFSSMIYKMSNTQIGTVGEIEKLNGKELFYKIQIVQPSKTYTEEICFFFAGRKTIYRYRILQFLNNKWIPILFSKDFNRITDTKKFNDYFDGYH